MKEMVPGLRFSVLLLLLSSLACMPATLLQRTAKDAAVEPTTISPTATIETPMDTVSEADNQPENSSEDIKWQKSGFSIDVPAPIDVVPDGQGIILKHSIPYGHTDICDFKDGQWLPELTDFHVRMELLPVASLVEAKIAAGYAYLEGEQKVQIGGLNGYLYSIGAEGCGQDVYFFPQEGSRTLLVIRNWVTELSPITPQHEDYLSLQGIIPPNEETELFMHILSSYQLDAAAEK